MINLPPLFPPSSLILCSDFVRVLFESCSQNGGFSEGFSNKTRRTLEEHTTEERWSLSLSLIVKYEEFVLSVDMSSVCHLPKSTWSGFCITVGFKVCSHLKSIETKMTSS